MKHLNILLVEEEPGFAAELLQVADARGHRVQLAPSVADALRTMTLERFDVLLADIGRGHRWHGRDVMVRLPGIAPVPYVLTADDRALDDEETWRDTPALDRLFTRFERDLAAERSSVAQA
jgi:DNA-binding response OmpR family regulator